ncbi:MAG: hypothetical protein E7350_00535 [Clostridiales bacterium]|nr:hypothetical protein [Clostridiales bacterium]
MIVLFLCAKKSTQKKRWGHFRECVPNPPQRVFAYSEKNKVGVEHNSNIVSAQDRVIWRKKQFAPKKKLCFHPKTSFNCARVRLAMNFDKVRESRTACYHKKQILLVRERLAITIDKKFGQSWR